MQIGHATQQSILPAQVSSPERAPVGEQKLEDASKVIAPVIETGKSQGAQGRELQRDYYDRGSSPSIDPPEVETPNTEAAQGPADSEAPKSESDQGEAAERTVERQRERQAAANEDQAQREEQLIIDQLKARDREVRAHEQAHAAVGGQYAGSPTYTFQQGPDGKKYAVGGEVSIDTSKVPDDPEATLQKAEIVRAAALAPAEPSAQDLRVAASATQMATEAKQDIAKETAEEIKEAGEVEEQEETSSQAAEETQSTQAADESRTAAADEESEEKESDDSVESTVTNAADGQNAGDRFAKVYEQIANNNIETYLLNAISDENPTGGLLSQIV